MASEGPLYAGTGANFNDGGAAAWQSPTNAEGDTSATSASLASGNTTSQRLRVTGFDFSAIPVGSTIDGIEVEVDCWNNGTSNRTQWSSLQLLIGGSESGNNLRSSGNWPNAQTFVSTGGATELWGLTPTRSQVAASDFGCSIKCARSNTTVPRVHRVRITVTYSAASVPHTANPSSSVGLSDLWLFARASTFSESVALDDNADPQLSGPPPETNVTREIRLSL